MADLFEEIAELLRRQRRPQSAAGSVPAPPRPPVSQPAVPPQPRHLLTCRFCSRRVATGEGAGLFHDQELGEAVSCAACHRRRLDEEALGTAWASVRQGWYRASKVRPRCKYCGRLLDPADRIPLDARVCPACAERDAGLAEGEEAR
jgi:hypothetical protein